MQQFEADDPMDLQTTGVQRDMLYPVRTEGVYCSYESVAQRPGEGRARQNRCAEEKTCL